jgi:hypothetical protein
VTAGKGRLVRNSAEITATDAQQLERLFSAKPYIFIWQSRCVREQKWQIDCVLRGRTHTQTTEERRSHIPSREYKVSTLLFGELNTYSCERRARQPALTDRHNAIGR